MLWLLFDMSLGIASGHRAIAAVHARSTMFLASVCALVSVIASPKQPQSFTGSATYIHTVTAVITTMSAASTFDTARRLMANITSTPSVNSIAASATAPHRVSQSGT